MIIIGIDEAGRGPIAGPVAVGLCAFLQETAARKMFRGVKESKQLSAGQREKVLERMQQAAEENIILYDVVFASAEAIDKQGISKVIRQAIAKLLRNTKMNPEKVDVRLDGLLHAPPEFIYQKTIIGGDDTELSIAMASIAAKVERDTYMERMHKRYPVYNFAQHKGYGTAGHYEALLEHGPSPLHRKTYIS
jgi:ribonuclease HII